MKVRQAFYGFQKRIAYSVALGLLLAVSGGCASFPKNKIPKATIGETPHETIVVEYTFEALDRVGAPFQESFRATHEQRFIREWESLGLRCFPQGSTPNPNLKAEVSYQLHTGNPGLITMWSAFTGYTLFTFPMWAGKDQSVRARITQSGAETAELHEATDGEVFVMWLPMALMAPFFPPFSRSEKIEINLYRHLGQKVLQDVRELNGIEH